MSHSPAPRSLQLTLRLLALSGIAALPLLVFVPGCGGGGSALTQHNSQPTFQPRTLNGQIDLGNNQTLNFQTFISKLGQSPATVAITSGATPALSTAKRAAAKTAAAIAEGTFEFICSISVGDGRPYWSVKLVGIINGKTMNVTVDIPYIDDPNNSTLKVTADYDGQSFVGTATQIKPTPTPTNSGQVTPTPPGQGEATPTPTSPSTTPPGVFAYNVTNIDAKLKTTSLIYGNNDLANSGSFKVRPSGAGQKIQSSVSFGNSGGGLNLEINLLKSSGAFKIGDSFDLSQQKSAFIATVTTPQTGTNRLSAKRGILRIEYVDPTEEATITIRVSNVVVGAAGTPFYDFTFNGTMTPYGH